MKWLSHSAPLNRRSRTSSLFQLHSCTSPETCVSINSGLNRLHTHPALGHARNHKSERLKSPKPTHYKRVAGQRARVPPEPIPNSEVKPRSVSGISVVFGHVKPEKLAAHFLRQPSAVEVPKTYNQVHIVISTSGKNATVRHRTCATSRA